MIPPPQPAFGGVFAEDCIGCNIARRQLQPLVEPQPSQT
jgi:hypothetical protein